MEKLPFIGILREADRRPQSVQVGTVQRANTLGVTVHKVIAQGAVALLSVKVPGIASSVPDLRGIDPHSAMTARVAAVLPFVVRDKAIDLFAQDRPGIGQPSVMIDKKDALLSGKVPRIVSSVPGHQAIGLRSIKTDLVAVVPHSVTIDRAAVVLHSVVRVKGTGPAAAVRLSVRIDLAAVAHIFVMTGQVEDLHFDKTDLGEGPPSKNEPVGNFLPRELVREAIVQVVVAPLSVTTVQGAVALHSEMIARVEDHLSVVTALREIARLSVPKAHLHLSLHPMTGLGTNVPGHQAIGPRSVVIVPVEDRPSVMTAQEASAPVVVALRSVMTDPGVVVPRSVVRVKATGLKLTALLSVRTVLRRTVQGTNVPLVPYRVRPGNAMPLDLTISVLGAIAPRLNRQHPVQGRPPVPARRPKRALMPFRHLAWKR